MISKEAMDYYTLVKNSNMYKDSLRTLMIEDDDDDDILKELSTIRKDFLKEITEKRKDIITMYACIDSYMNMIDDSFHEEDMDENIEQYLGEINQLYNSIENVSLEIQVRKESIEFIEYMETCLANFGTDTDEFSIAMGKVANKELANHILKHSKNESFTKAAEDMINMINKEEE